MILSLRLGGTMHRDQSYIDRLLESLKRCGNCFDEVWIATSYGLLSVEQCKKEAEMMAETASKFRKAGITASMQVSRTIGHGDNLLKIYGGDGVKNFHADRITSIDGAVSVAQFCWNNEEFRKYIAESLKAYAAFQPEIVWVDDDLRIRHHGKSKALCFCDHCLSLYNRRYGHQYTRAALKEDFLVRNSGIRKEYIEFQTRSLAEFAEIIAKAIREGSPNSVMALQNGGNTALATDAQRACLDAMKEVSGKAPAFRAGGGFYDDHNPYQMVDKALLLNYMNSRLPDYVKMRSSEIENLPFVAYGKSAESTCLEAALYMAYGCNMASITLMNTAEPLTYHEELFRKLSLYKPFYEQFAEKNRNTVNDGLCVYQPPRSCLNYMRSEQSEAWNDSAIQEFSFWARCGIPVQTGLTGNAFLVSAKAADYMNEDDIDFLLRKPVVIDGAAIDTLCRAGYGSRLPVSVSMLPDFCQNAVCENATAHPVNEGLPLIRKWHDSAYYAKGKAYAVIGDNLESISEYTSDETGEPLGCALAIVRTEYGARWFVKGSSLQNRGMSFERRSQILRAINAIIPDRPLTYVSTPTQTVIIPRIDAQGKTVSVTVLNVSPTDSEDVTISVPNPGNTQKCILSDPYGGDTAVPVTSVDKGYAVEIGELHPWRMKTCYFDTRDE